jgi:hypothetical protein
MPAFIAGLIVLYLLLFGVKQFSRLSPAAAARLVRQGGGVLGVIGALVLLLRGSVLLASLLASVALSFAGWRGAANLGAMFRGAGSGRNRASAARSALIEMRLDHESGQMTGWILAGPLQGQSLDMLARPACLDLYQTCLKDDPDGARLLETYLDRRFAGWRETAEGQGDARRASAGGVMTEKEAYETLGLAPGANAQEITRAHRALMKKLHPDHGGATSLAARVNEAKDVLLRRH